MLVVTLNILAAALLVYLFVNIQPLLTKWYQSRGQNFLPKEHIRHRYDLDASRVLLLSLVGVLISNTSRDPTILFWYPVVLLILLGLVLGGRLLMELLIKIWPSFKERYATIIILYFILLWLGFGIWGLM